MKKIFCILTIAAMCMAFILPVAATETEWGTGAPEESLTTAEGVDETVTATETDEAASVTETIADTDDIAAIIGGADSKLEAIVELAGAMGITLEEAEAILDKMVALGDEHLGESDIWVEIKASILKNPETWTIVVLVILMLIALAIFLIRGQIRNTSEQATTKANIIDIKKNEVEISDKIKEVDAKFASIEHEHEEIKLGMDEIYNMATLMLSAVDLLKANSETSLNVNREQALQTVQLLNIVMGRPMPRVSESTRKVWYEDAVAKIKEKAGVSGETTDETTTPVEQ